MRGVCEPAAGCAGARGARAPSMEKSRGVAPAMAIPVSVRDARSSQYVCGGGGKEAFRGPQPIRDQGT